MHKRPLQNKPQDHNDTEIDGHFPQTQPQVFENRHVESDRSSDFDDSSDEDFIDKRAPEDDDLDDLSLIDELDAGERLESSAIVVDERLESGAAAVVDERLEGYQSDDKSVISDETDEDDEDEHRTVPEVRGDCFRDEERHPIELVPGTTFIDVHHFRKVMRDYRVQQGFVMKQLKNDNVRFTATCADTSCSWRIHASRLQDNVTFMIKSCRGQHTCNKVFKNGAANSAWIANNYGDFIREHPKVNAAALTSLLMREHCVEVHPQVVWRARRIALRGLIEQHAEDFNKLRRYAYMVGQHNPGSKCVIHQSTLDNTQAPKFMRIFLSFTAQKIGFCTGCRPFIGIDGCHLWGSFEGILLSAVSLDANCGIFPLGVAVVEKKTKSSWCWFLEQLRQHLGEECHTEKITFMTDRQKGIIAALEKEFPLSHVRFCVRHILANIKKDVKGALPKSYFWKAARSCNQVDFKSNMEHIRRINPAMYRYLEAVDPKHWSRHAFDKSCKSDHITNNMTESWNASLDKIRGKSIIALLEDIRRRITAIYSARRFTSSRWGSDIPPEVKTKINKQMRKARDVHTLLSGGRIYEVMCGSRHFITNMNARSCDCGYWEVSGIPCMHAIKCLERGETVDSLVDNYLRQQMFKNTYEVMIHPIPDHASWPEVEADSLQPPDIQRRAGRPKGTRRKEPGSPTSSRKRGLVTCTTCRERGHNKRSCPLNKRTRIQVRINEHGEASGAGPSTDHGGPSGHAGDAARREDDATAGQA